MNFEPTEVYVLSSISRILHDTSILHKKLLFCK